MWLALADHPFSQASRSVRIQLVDPYEDGCQAGWLAVAGAITGRPAAAQAVNPPPRTVAWMRPSCCRAAAARLDWQPWLQMRMMCRSRPVIAGCRHSEAGRNAIPGSFGAALGRRG